MLVLELIDCWPLNVCFVFCFPMCQCTLCHDKQCSCILWEILYTQIPRQYLVLPTLVKASLLEIETHWGFRDDLILLRAGIHSPEQLTISI